MKAHKIIKSVLALSLAVIAVSSCQEKMKGFGFSKGEVVRFSVGTEGSSLDTKAAYSGVEANSKERIDWEAGDDLIRIYCDAVDEPSTKWADYAVTSAEASTTNPEKSLARIAGTGGVGLRWGEGEHIFYAAYPSPASGGIATDITGKTVTGNLTSGDQGNKGKTETSSGSGSYVVEPDLKWMLMTAKAGPYTEEGGIPTGKDNDKVFLDFQPLTTAIDFTIYNGNKNAALDVNKIMLISENTQISGTFTVDLDTVEGGYAKCTGTASDSKQVCIDFSSLGISLAQATGDGTANCKSLKFTFFLAPTTDVSDLTFKLYKNASDWMSTKLGYTDGSGVWFPCHKKSSVTGLIVPEGAQWTVNYGSAGAEDPNAVTVVTKWNTGVNKSLNFGDDSDPDLLPGKFSVSANDYVQFSCGNLQATYHSSGSYTWAIARNQYDYVGNAAGNTTIGGQSDGAVVDLFGWTAAGKYNDGIQQYGINVSLSYLDYYIDEDDKCCDWGKTIGSKDIVWSVLSNEDWNYLVNTRKIKRSGTADAASGFGNTCQWVKYNGVSGILIYPDEYDGTKYAKNAEIGLADFPSDCVFLPAAGIRNGSSVSDAASGGRYWSNTVVSTYNAYSFDFNQSGTSSAMDRNRYAGQSVRLVQRFFKPHDAVNIGGKYWATMNVGATTVAGSYSTCYGDYFAWGETEPYYSQKTISETGTVTFIWKTTPKDYKTKGYGSDYDNYKWGKPGGSGFTKYNNSDGKIVLDAEDDAVTHNWGPSWRMPTEEDFMALLYACTGSTGSESLTPSTLSSKNPEGGVYWLSDDQTILMEYNGVAGCLFVDRSDPDKRVFFPAAGDISGTNCNNVGSSCFYWSRTRNTNDPCGVFRLKLNNSSIELKYNESRYNGFPIRPVHD